MFTGIVQAVGRVDSLTPIAAGLRLRIDPQGWWHRPEPGESIAVSGVCLTCLGREAELPLLEFDVVPETMMRTTLGSLAPGSRVNLERSLRADSLLDGHLVQGHVDALGTVERIVREPEWRVRIRTPESLTPLVVPKGSIAVDGVSLTIASAEPGRAAFEVALIPATLERTTLGGLVEGSHVNLETDIIARAVVHAMAHSRAMT
ncbi:MAG: riboflavin synthase [Phycisphaerales bacterium]|nr:riboflavin synthase [Phycisphaerales bacterium]